MRVITERKVDELGRVVIPLKIRERYHIFPGDSVRIVEDTDGISVEPNLSLCRLCSAPLPEEGEYLLCDECLSDIRRESHSAPKVIPLVFTKGREAEETLCPDDTRRSTDRSVRVRHGES